MAKHRRFRLSAALLTIAVFALFFSRGLSFWFLLLITQLIAISLCIEILTRHIPASLISSSRDNCFRMDGSRSHRRTARERRALRKVGSDLWAVFLMVALFGTGGIYWLNAFVFPASAAGDVISAVLDNPGDLRVALKQRGVDTEYFKWSRSTSRKSNVEIRHSQQLLWAIWPAIFILLAVGCVGCCALIRYAYLRSLREFHDGLQRRSNEYLNLDTGRLQG